MTAFRSLRYVVEACNYALGDDQLVLQRRAYHWRRVGKVLPNGPGHTQGTGNSQRYNETTIPLIAVLLQVSARYSSIEELDAISLAIQRRLAQPRAPFARCWTAALARARGVISPKSAPELAEISKENWLTIAFAGWGGPLDVRCGPTVITDHNTDVDIYAVSLDFIFISLAEFQRSDRP